jgi:hypothetical protein
MSSPMVAAALMAVWHMHVVEAGRGHVFGAGCLRVIP